MSVIGSDHEARPSPLRLAFSHAALAVVLVAIAGNRIEAQSRVADHERAVAVAERDADVLAARACVYGRAPLVTDLVGDEQVGSCRVEVVDPDLSNVAGDDLVALPRRLTAAARVLADGTPSTAALGTRAVVAASPIVADSVLVGVAMVAEVVPNSVPGLASFGVSNWLGAFLILVAAGAGWLLAGALSKPIAELTDDARRLALGTVVTDRTRGASPRSTRCRRRSVASPAGDTEATSWQLNRRSPCARCRIACHISCARRWRSFVSGSTTWPIRTFRPISASSWAKSSPGRSNVSIGSARSSPSSIPRGGS